MLCTDKGSMAQAQYSPGLSYGMATCSIPLFPDDRTRVVQVNYPFQIFVIDWLLMLVNQTQVGADLRYLLL